MLRYVSFLGPPGSGKTTQIRLLAELLGSALVIASVPRLIRQQPDLLELLTPPEATELASLLGSAAAARSRGDLAPLGIDRLLFDALTRIDSNGIVALDGCPRGLAQARLFLSEERLLSGTVVVALDFPDDTFGWSLRRQLTREAERLGGELALAKRDVFERKARVFLEDTKPGRDLLRKAGMPFLDVDASDDQQQIHRRICRWLDLVPAGSTRLAGVEL